MNNLLFPSPVNTKRLFYDKKTKTFLADASDLQGVQLKPVYSDAADVGFTLVSQRTRAQVPVVWNGDMRDTDGELIYSDFIPAAPKHRKLFAGVRVYND
jgi:hypothetical protein